MVRMKVMMKKVMKMMKEKKMRTSRENVSSQRSHPLKAHLPPMRSWNDRKHLGA